MTETMTICAGCGEAILPRAPRCTPPRVEHAVGRNRIGYWRVGHWGLGPNQYHPGCWAAERHDQTERP